jgi:hypothetical protein
LLGIFMKAMSFHATQTPIGAAKGRNHSAVGAAISTAARVSLT